MKAFITKYKLIILGILVGAVAGYAYYYYVGCSSGTCAITSNPWRMTLYGSLMGGLFFDMFRKPSKSETPKNNKNNNSETI